MSPELNLMISKIILLPVDDLSYNNDGTVQKVIPTREGVDMIR